MPLIEHQPSDAINRGTAWNTLVLRCVGNLISAAINGTEVAALHQERTGYGMVAFGVALGEGVPAGEARFKNLVVARHPADSPPLGPPSDVAPKPENILVKLTFDDPAGADSFIVPRPMPGYQTDVEAGEFVVRTADDPWSSGPGAGHPMQVGDAITTVDVRVVGETTNRIVALACRVGVDANWTLRGGYVLYVDPGEGAFVLQRIDGDNPRQVFVLSEWRAHPAINRGDAPNRLTLRCIGDTITAVINGHEVASVRDSAYRVGLSGVTVYVDGGVRGGMEARFDNFVIARP